MLGNTKKHAKTRAQKILLYINAIIITVSSILPFILTQQAGATQLTNRFAYQDTGTVSSTFNLGVQFRLASSSVVRQAELEFCTTPIGTCVGVGGTSVPTMPAATPAFTKNNQASNDYWTNATAFTGYTISAGRNGGTNNQIAVNRAAGAAESQVSTNDRGLYFPGFTHIATANTSFYVRIRLYSDLGTTLVYDGNVAQSTNRTLTINARIQENLEFCVGTTTINSATTQLTNAANAGNVTSCATADGTSIDLGVVSSSNINITPVPVLGGSGDNRLGYAMVRTNSVNGVVIGYRAIQDTSSGKLKVVGATCSGVSVVDSCFNSQGGTQGAFTSGTENFGMLIAGVNCVNTGTSYGGGACSYATGSNLCIKANYFQTTTHTCGGVSTYQVFSGVNATSTAQFAWVDTGSAVTTIAGSDLSTMKVVNNEALMIKFGATASATIPTGVYQVNADFVATPTF